MKLSALTSGRENNLNALRLFAALFVVLSHIDGAPMCFILRDTIGQLGVLTFFFISGVLITQSWLRDENPKRFLISRCLRIFPALIALVLVVAFMVGPIMTTLPLAEYFKSGQTYLYLTTISLFHWNNTLPGMPIVELFNYAIWTLQYEFAFYLFIMALGIFKVLRFKYVILALTIAALIWTQFTINQPYNIFTVNAEQISRLFAYFSAGATVYLFRDSIPLKKWWIRITLAVLFVGALFGGLPTSLFVFPLAYLVIYLGYSPTINLRALTKFGDFSYGIYIWHYPIVALIVFKYGLNGTFGVLLLIFGVTYSVAVASWYLIEKRALKLKGRLAL